MVSNPGTMRWAALLAAEVIGVTAGLLALLGMLIPLGTTVLVAGPGLALPLALLAALPVFLSLPVDYPTTARLGFSLARSIVAVGPPAAVGLTLVFSSAFPGLQRDPLVGVLALVIMGVWAGGSLTVALLISPHRSEPPTLRWLGVSGALLLAALIWWSDPLRQTEALALAPLLAGLALGLLRPLSYLWEMSLSAALALATRLEMPAHQLLRFHPVALDELCLMPLPGLAALLERACEEEVTQGGPWLLSVAAHPGQSGAARRSLEALVRGRHAHPLLFWLSTHEEGAAWLRRLAEGPRRSHPLIAAYAALALIDEPAAWPSAITVHRHALAAAAGQPGGAAVQALVEAGAQIIAADRWPAAMAALRDTPRPHGVVADPLWGALEHIRAWSDQQPALIHDRAQTLATLWDSLDDLEGWPARLLDAMAEHLVYLLILEHRRGAWLV